MGQKSAIDPKHPGANRAGRPKGVPNKTTTRAREAITMLVEDNLDNMALWLYEIHENDGPLPAMRVMIDLLEYAIPKLARQEITHSVSDDTTSVEFKVTAPTQPASFEVPDDNGD